MSSSSSEVYKMLGVAPVINAAGPLTLFGGVLMHPEVVQAMNDASHDYVDIKLLEKRAGQYLAERLRAEAAHICGCASAGLTLTAAACMTGIDAERIGRIPDTTGMANKFVVHRHHRNPFDHAMYIAGARFIEVDADEKALREALQQPDVAGLFYIFAWFCKGETLPLAQVAEIAHEYEKPVIVDAAQVPPAGSFSQYLREGADLVIFSGGKLLRGPQTSGLILGRKDLIQACTLNDGPNIKSIGRGMKVSKESIVGLIKAIEIYLRTDQQKKIAVWEEKVNYLQRVLSAIADSELKRVVPLEAGQPVPYLELRWPQDNVFMSYKRLVEQMLAGEPSVAVRLVEEGFSDVASTHIRLAVHTLKDGEEKIVAQKIKALLTEVS
ncbi:MAG: aminotransferase class V-fold PLP-dependent enzyme [Deferribacteres bacterium]|nr:aminotransferase class V-fold PLP-dependent enzyme [candidate division KSB1 bacterium]MCB9512651.1 aminotransferase class V-fold PLP-dependent enzyme [Deferribacteres bacterium]